ncbi:MAG: hypothetical protein GDA55_04750 [Cellvibrionales bacterium]|nr:hypothetical protein [Cellvibrionales bacterium]
MKFEFVNIPQLGIARGGRRAAKPQYNPEKRYVFHYDVREHLIQPHVVKFSGGRSSGMLLLALLNGGVLRADRGDVVVFNNTSAEHPATYDFAARLKKITEQEYGIPFFWTEFQTYEDAVNGDWVRLPSYRLVNARPYSDKNPDGYHSGGEVFEELISWKKFLPNQFKRICTAEMKLFVTKEFLRDWFARKPSIDRLGHYYEHSMQDNETITRLHKRNGGATPDNILLQKTAYVRSRPTFRPHQEYATFSELSGKVNNSDLDGKQRGGRVALEGDHCVDYAAFVGFRGDEPARLARMKARNYDRVELDNGGDPHIAAPEGEYVYAPLADMGITKEDVFAFWRENKKHDLRLPHQVNFSNCVFCFLKGSGNLVDNIASREKVEKRLPKKFQSRPDTPADIAWWANIEQKYGRDLRREGRTINSETAGENPIVGFWGMNGKLSYKQLAESRCKPEKLSIIREENAALPCDCTD